MAYDFNSLMKQADEASNRDKFYTDFEDVDQSKLHQITELTEWMRTKAKGSDVREIIAQLFERTWLENIKEGNANMEVAQARGTHPNLRSRLDESDKKQRQNTAQLAQKANKDEVTNVMTPKGTLAYASLPTSGNQVGWYYYCPDGDGSHGAGNYVWNGTTWYFGGTGDEGYNLLKKDLANIGYYIENNVELDGDTNNLPTITFSKPIPSGTKVVLKIEYGNNNGESECSFKNSSGENFQTIRFTSSFEQELVLTETALKIGFYIPNGIKFKFSIYINGIVFKNAKSIEELKNTTNVRPIIYDTDFAWDIDDAFAIRVLAWGTNNGLIDLMGVNLSKTNEKSVSALDGILCEEGIGDCVISKNSTQTGTLRTYHTIFSDFPNHKFTSNSDAISDVIMYRKALSSLPQGVKCDIVCVGLLNSISRLLNSKSDSYSHMNGIDLVMEKVNRLWVMGGDFYNSSYAEPNFSEDVESTKNVFNNFPCEIVVQGNEIATRDIADMTVETLILEGSNLGENYSTNDYLYKAYLSWKADEPSGKSVAFDPLLVLASIENDEFVSGYYYDKGTITINDNGTCSFSPNENGKHFVTRKSFNNYFYEHKLNQILYKKGWISADKKKFRLKR